MANWQQLEFTVHKPLAEFCAELLEGYGALSVTYQDAADTPIFEPLPGESLLWEQVNVIGLFAGAAEMEPCYQALLQALPAESLETLKRLDLAEQNWSRAWLKYFKPLQFGQSLWIIPAGFEPVDLTAVNMHLDPGLAFGTGTHPTTALCLQWLEGHRPQDKTVIDYGCGSGVLAVAAGLLGARTVTATDIDPQALLATQQNAKKNQLTNIETLAAKTNLELPVADVVLANILAGPLVDLAEQLASYVKPGGCLVLSGLLEKQAEVVCAAYAPWFSLKEPIIKEDWACVVGQKQ